MNVYVDRSIVYKSVENIVKWPLQNEDNFYSSALSAIVFIASQRFLNVSYIFSIVLTTTVFWSIRRYQILKSSKVEEAQKKELEERTRVATQKKELEKRQSENYARIIIEAFEKEEERKGIQKRNENIEAMKFFLLKDLLYMINVFRGYEETESKEKVNENEFSEQKEKFIKLCEYFNLDFMTFSSIFIKFPAGGQDEFLEHVKKRADFFFTQI